MKKLVKNLVLVSLMLVFAAVAVADDKKAPKKGKRKRPTAGARGGSAGLLKRFPEADKNKDGKLSNEEMKAFRAVMAKKMAAKMLKDNPKADTNKDGKLSREEIAAFRKANAKKRPANAKKRPTDAKDGKKRPADARNRNPWTNPTPEMVKRILERHPEADKNKDGKLDKAEMEALRKTFMNRPMPAERAKKMIAENPGIDANKDGKLTMGEVQKWYQAKNKAKAPVKNDKKKAPKKGAKKKGPSEEQLAKMLKRTPKADANKDGKLTAEEAMAFRKAQGPARLLKKHPEADKNKDGKLSADEMKELKKTIRDAQKAKRDKDKEKKAKGPKKGKGKKKK